MTLEKPVFLVGYMCSGKSTLGRALARSLDCEFIDLDDEVEARAGRPITEIFATDGEAAFRRMESEAMVRLLNRRAVIALGGGTPCHNDNMEAVNRAGLSVFLEAPVERLVERLVLGADKRPLAAGKNVDELTQLVTSGLAARGPFYRKARYRFDSSSLENQSQIDESVNRFIAQFLQ